MTEPETEGYMIDFDTAEAQLRQLAVSENVDLNLLLEEAGLHFLKDEIEPSEWTLEQTEECLNKLLSADTPERFRGLCDEIAKTQRRSAGRAVLRHIWGISNHLIDVPIKAVRRKGPLTYGEMTVIKWAANSTTKDKRKKEHPTPAYIAKIIGRTVKVAEKAWKKLGPAKGRDGFGVV